MYKQTKYRSKKVEVDWYKFPSKVEAEYYLFLKNSWEKFEVHPKYILQNKYIHPRTKEKMRAVFYEADFSYWSIVIDIKGQATETAKLKRKMFMFRYPELELKRIVKYNWQRVDYFDNEERKRNNKKNRLQNTSVLL